MKLNICVIQFFNQYLPRIKGVSEHTISTYHSTFSIFLPFAAQYFCIKIESLKVEHLSVNLVIAFLDYLETHRKNIAATRNQRLAALKSFLRMISFLYPEEKEFIEMIMDIPQKNTQKKIIGFLYEDEVFKVFDSVDLKKNEGFRDYTMLNLLYDSGARASEIATINLDYFDSQHKTLAILGKGNRYRLVKLCLKTVQLLKLYIIKYRAIPKSIYRHRLFINQRREEITRYGINRICKKHLSKALPSERVKFLNPVHCFRHSCAVNMLSSGFTIPEIKIHLGHQSIGSTLKYLHLDLFFKQRMGGKVNELNNSHISQDPKIENLIDWKNRHKLLEWLDSL